MDNFYKASEIIKDRFIRVPKVILYNERYDGLSAACILAYGILQDRFELSIKNGWIDNNDNIYMVFDREELGEILRVKRATASRYIKELESYDLLLDKRMGLNKANRIYMKKPIADAKYVYESKQRQRMYENDTSGGTIKVHQKVTKEYTNDTDLKDTDYIDTQSFTPKTNEGMNDFKKLIDDIDLYYYEEKEVIEEAMRILYFSNTPLIINNTTVPLNQVRANLKKVTASTIDNALRDFYKASKEQQIRNVTAYLSKCIYNSIFDGDMKIKSDISFRYGY